MDDELHPALLPQGMRDLLPPDAAIEASVVERIMTALAAHGYERVKPPMLEFEEGLLGGGGAAMASDTFRLMDPESHRMIGLRADMTMQIARIATVRLVKAPRPLRLSYAGQVLRVRGTQLRPERQFGQIGAELIGSEAPEADAEVVTLAAETLGALGVADISVDLDVPTLVPGILEALGIAAASGPLRAALDHKDAAAIDAEGGAAAPLLKRLIATSGKADRALAALRQIGLPPGPLAEVERLAAIVARIRRDLPGLELTIDPVESRGFEYHCGMSFTIFAQGLRGELGRGGRYRAGRGGTTEAATGFTLYTDTVIRGVPPSPPMRRIYLPAGTGRAAGVALREEGWVTVAALDGAAPEVEAVRLGCGHIYRDGAIRRLD